jgi:hypothetical protein
MSENDFDCDECGTKFAVGQGGFLGSIDDFEFQMSEQERKDFKDDFECSPFMNYVQLCRDCYKIKLEQK